jgi:hypothetical protein
MIRFRLADELVRFLHFRDSMINKKVILLAFVFSCGLQASDSITERADKKRKLSSDDNPTVEAVAYLGQFKTAQRIGIKLRSFKSEEEANIFLDTYCLGKKRNKWMKRLNKMTRPSALTLAQYLQQKHPDTLTLQNNAAKRATLAQALIGKQEGDRYLADSIQSMACLERLKATNGATEAIAQKIAEEQKRFDDFVAQSKETVKAWHKARTFGGFKYALHDYALRQQKTKSRREKDRQNNRGRFAGTHGSGDGPTAAC